MKENSEPRRLTRTRDGRMLTGVCSGAAAYFGVDPNVVRIGLGVLTLLTGGTGILVYVAAVFVVPEEGKDTSILQDLINRQTDKQTH